MSWLFENLCVSACVVCVRACFRCVGSTILRVCRLGLLTNVRANLYLCVLPIPQLGCDFCSGFFDILYGLSNCNSHFHSPFSFLLSAFPHVIFSCSNCVDQKEDVVQVRKKILCIHLSCIHLPSLYLSVYTMFTYMQHK